MSDWTVTTRGFKELSARFNDAPRKIADIGRDWAKDVAADETKFIQRAAPSKTGRFRRTITPYSRAFVIGVKFLPYPKLGLKLKDFIIEGTRPHFIIARKARALSFVWKGKRRFFVSVHHPGTKPNDFITKGARAFNPKVRGWLNELSKRIIKVMGG